jgi:hypothetical protein
MYRVRLEYDFLFVMLVEHPLAELSKSLLRANDLVDIGLHEECEGLRAEDIIILPKWNGPRHA